VPLSEMIEGMEKRVDEGKIVRWGVSNLDTADMKELFSLPNGTHCVTDRILYPSGLPWHRVRFIALDERA
jgi:diketogulonate reductase-like aldo/keto reductase